MMSTSPRLLLTVVLVSSAAAVVVPYYPSHLALPDNNLKNQMKAQQDSGKADDGLAVAYLPAYAIPEGSPVDPCVTCRPRRTTHNCRRNTRDGCPSRSSPTCTTKQRCSSSQSPTEFKKRSSSSTLYPRPAASSLSSTAGDATKRSPPSSITRVKPTPNDGPQRFGSNVL